jgi:hypothetical protein
MDTNAPLSFWIILVSSGFLILGVITVGFFLWLSTSKILKFKKQQGDFIIALKISLILAVVGIIIGKMPLLGFFVWALMFIYLIRCFYKVGWKEALFAWFITFIFSNVGIGIIGIIFFTITSTTTPWVTRV